MTDELKPELNYIPVTPPESNIVPSANGSIVKDGTLQSPNYIPGSAGWKLDSNGVISAVDVVIGGKVNMSTKNSDSGVINDFTNFTSAVAGSGAIVKSLRQASVATGITGNSTAIIYSEFPANGDYWDFSSANIDINFRVYIDEGWEPTTTDAKVYLKYGGGITADRGGVGDKVFGVELSGTNSDGGIDVVAFARNLSTIVTGTMVSGLDGLYVASSYNFRIVSSTEQDKVYFYIDGVLKMTLALTLNGTVATPNIFWGASIVGSVANSSSEIVVNQVSYIFTY